MLSEKLKLQTKIEALKKDLLDANNLGKVDEVRVQFKALEKTVFDFLKTVRQKEENVLFRSLMQSFKQTLKEKELILKSQKIFEKAKKTSKQTKSSFTMLRGKVNLLKESISEMYLIMQSLGYRFIKSEVVVNYSENFTFLGIGDNHPLVEETVCLDEKARILLRSHTTSFQESVVSMKMENFKTFTLGKVFRSDYSRTHYPCFHQLDIFEVHEACNISYLIGVLKCVVTRFLSLDNVELEIKMSNFPFTNPSFEAYLNGIEICGFGLVSEKISKKLGCAAGIGIDRLAMIKYGIGDIRQFWTEL